jgi:hypothetical protein
MGGEEKRESERHPIAFPVVCDDGDNYVDGTVLDLSLGGCFVHTRRLLPVDTRVTVSPVGKVGEWVDEIQARVVRVVDAPDAEGVSGMGLQFTRIRRSGFEGLQRIFAEMPRTSASEALGPRPAAADDPVAVMRARVRVWGRRR